jgi:hypothetical protein
MSYGVRLALQNAVNRNSEKQKKKIKIKIYIWHLIVNIISIAALSVLQIVVFIKCHIVLM